VVGVSGDSVKTQEMFKKENKLPFTLLADEKGEVAKALGVPVKVGSAKFKTKINGEEVEFERGCTISRWTVIIGKDGKIAYKEAVMNAGGDGKKVLEAIEKLGK
jgi:peroxiredoxin Q/BCP